MRDAVRRCAATLLAGGVLASAAALAGAEQPGGLYRGRTSAGGSVSARVAPRGGYLALLRVQWRARCATGAVLSGATDQSQIAIGAEGGYRLRGVYTLALADGVRAHVIADQRGRLSGRRISGRFRAGATVHGRSGAVMDRCDTGELSYSARRVRP